VSSIISIDIFRTGILLLRDYRQVRQVVYCKFIKFHQYRLNCAYMTIGRMDGQGDSFFAEGGGGINKCL